MKATERASLWQHTVFSSLLCLTMIGLVLVRKDWTTLVVVGFVMLYVAGNTLLHIRRHDFRRETMYEYVIIGAAVLIVFISAQQ
jgi:uncharacterized membrane protein